VGLFGAASTLRLEQGAAAAVSLLSTTRSLPFAPRHVDAGPLSFILGDAVTLTHDKAKHNANTKPGPLKLDGPAGEVIEFMNTTDGRINVRAAGTTWWYDPSELELVSPHPDIEPLRLGDRVGDFSGGNEDNFRAGVVVAAHTRPPSALPDSLDSVMSALWMDKVRVRLMDGSCMWYKSDSVFHLNAERLPHFEEPAARRDACCGNGGAHCSRRRPRRRAACDFAGWRQARSVRPGR
jgi:hypothetical protein